MQVIYFLIFYPEPHGSAFGAVSSRWFRNGQCRISWVLSRRSLFLWPAQG